MIEILAVAIPLEQFDQQKLEFLVRKIPAALVRTETLTVEKRFYEFPKMDDKGFKIKCESEHHLGSQFPSKSSCTLNILKDIDQRYDEHLVEFKDPYVVKSLFEAMSYGRDVKKFYSNERVYGVSVNGKYVDHFRFALSCSTEKCQFNMSLGKPKDL
jgi:hypothetical protein